jgi:hypothetical protein
MQGGEQVSGSSRRYLTSIPVESWVPSIKLLMHSSTSLFRSWIKPASAARLIALRKAFSCARSESFRAMPASELFRNCARQRKLVEEWGKGEERCEELRHLSSASTRIPVPLSVSVSPCNLSSAWTMSISSLILTQMP